MEGFLLIDKPSGPTSHDIVDEIRRILKFQKPYTLNAKRYTLPKIGHAGTLDPFASGLLIIGVDRATKEMNKLIGLDKEYIATLRLGSVSDTYDRTGVIKVSEVQGVKVSEADIKEVLKKFVGSIQQIPPMFSAKKVKGKKLYELARKGIEIERQPISITIYGIELLSFQKLPTTHYQLQTRIHCSSGTYIRTLAHDIGQALGCGAYVEELRRTMIGPFRIEEAVSLRELIKEDIETKILSISNLLAKI